MTGPITFTGNGLTATITDPENITREECLALAKCGAAEWNKWRGDYPGDQSKNLARFQGGDFVREEISFEGFNFGQVNFDGARFPSAQNFVHCRFGNSTSFEDATFLGTARFSGSYFGAVDFSGSRFADVADFKACDFGGSAHFVECKFEAQVLFAGAFLRKDARFDYSYFKNDAHFAGALFGSDTSFICCDFAERADFEAWDWSDLRYVFQAPNRTLVDAQSLADKLSMSPIQMGEIDFSGSVFRGFVSFAGRSFRARASFDVGQRITHNLPELLEGIWPSSIEPTRFAQPPQFFDCKISQQLTFDDAVFPPPFGDTTSARAYRTLKLAFSEQQATREEQRFFKLEMQEEAAAESGWKRWLYRAYEVTSDFGFSVWRPLVTLVVLPALVAMLLYLLCMCIQHPELWTSGLAQDSMLTSAWLQFTFANMAPLPDGELLKDLRECLFGSNTYAAVIALKLETLQKVLALVGYFLFGLALRNLFKMK
jgi:uncharacterized protein YjbI with pentapeptide repeats